MRKTVTRFKLWKEISLILVFKALVILALWYFFFSDPIEKHLTPRKVAQQLLGKRAVKSQPKVRAREFWLA